MQFEKYTDNSDIALGGGKLYIAKSSDITTKMIDTNTATSAEINEFIETLISEMKNIATVEGGVEIKPTYEYIDAKVDGEIFKKFATSPQTTLTTTVAEINVENMADFLMGGTYNVNASSVEELTFDGDHTPKECYILYIMEDTATSAKYVAILPRCSATSTFTFSTNAKTQITSDMSFGVYKPTEAIAESTGISAIFKLIKIPAATAD